MYVLVFNVHQRAEMDARLRAFIGPSWSDFPLGRRLDRADPVDEAVMGFTQNWGFKLRLLGEGDTLAQVRTALNLLRRCDDSRPVEIRPAKRPLSKLVYEFELALSLRDQTAAEEALWMLRQSRRLSQENLWFLRIQLWSRFGRWKEIEEHPTTHDVACLRRRPHEVAEDLLEAALRVRVLASGANPETALGAWTKTVDPAVRGLVTETSRPSRPSTHVCLMLEAIASAWDSAGDIARQAASSVGADAPERALLDGLVAQAPAATEPTEERVRQLLESGEAHSAWLLARELPPTPGVLKLMVEAVCRAALPEGAEELAEKLTTLGGADTGLGETDGPDSIGITVLRSAGGAEPREPCHGWTEWLERAAGGSADAVEHLAHARERADAWSQLGVGRSEADLARLGHAFDGALQANRKLVRGALPLLLDCLVADDRWGTLELQPLAFELADALLLSLEEGIGELDLSALGELFSAAMKEGVAEQRLTDSCLQLASEYEENLPLALLAAGIDLVEVLYMFASNKAAALVPVGATLGRVARQAPHRVPEMTRRSLNQLLVDLSLEPVFGEEERSEQDDPLAWLRGKKIGLYSLNEASIRRAKTQIESALDGDVDVRLEHSKVATPSLESLASRCDVVVMVTGAAKHAATACIEANLGPRTQLLRVHTQGTARLMDLLGRGPTELVEART